jgi:hypothetical protein
MEGERWTRRIYEVSKREAERGKKNWCTYTRKLLVELGLEEVWESEEVGTVDEWNERVTEGLKAREEKNWMEEVGLVWLEGKSKAKLRTYKLLKKSLRTEEYVLENRMSYGRRLLCAIRTGSCPLRVETGRLLNPPLPWKDRICWCCGEGVEDERHLVVDCRYYAEERMGMLARLDERLGGVVKFVQLLDSQPKILFKLLVGGTNQIKRSQGLRIVQSFLVKAMMKRRRFCEEAGIMAREL